METGISIVFPHAFNAENNRVLDLNLEMINENSARPVEVLTLGNTMRPDLVYEGWNYLISKAKYNLVLWHNTDLLLAPGWDDPIPKLSESLDWISLRVVECGAIGVASTMTCKDFGRTAQTFRRQEFENFIKNESAKKPESEAGWVWYCPSVLKKDKFLALGGFNNEKAFPNPNDIDFKLKAEAAGWRFGISNHSWAYHLQRGHIHQGLQQERV